MRANVLKGILHSAFAALMVLLISVGAAQAQVALNAKPAMAVLSDGQSVPMWGLFCGAPTATLPTCATLNAHAAAGSWQPPIITVQAGSNLTITLTNSLKVPTSLIIVGQLGGGLGNAPTRTPSPAHAPQTVTWPIGGDGSGPLFTPPAQAARVQSFGTEVAPGATQALTWPAMKAGTYLLESGTHPSIQGPMGLYGVVVVTDTSAAPSQAYPGVSYDASMPLLLSEIDPVQNAAVDAAVNNPGFSETAVWRGTAGGCGDVSQPITAHTCYPPAVNYDPRYFLINGASFDRNNPAASALAVTATTGSGRVLLRFVNAGLRMHVPSVVGLNMALIAEDGNVQPDVALALSRSLVPQPKVQSEIFLAAGKTYDAIVTPPGTAGNLTPAAYAVFDRQLSLSTNNQRDGGMQAYLQVNGGALPAASTTAVANPDTFYLVTGNPMTVADPAKGVLANDVGVYSVQLLTPPAGGTVTLNANGTFTYVPASGTTSDSFTYQANGNPAIFATVTLANCATTTGCLTGAPTAKADAYTSNLASRMQVSPPGVLANDVDPGKHPLTAVLDSVSGVNVTLNPDGSFIATPLAAVTATTNLSFTYHAVNSQNQSSNSVTATLTFQKPSGLAVTVKDAPTGLPISDYRWIIEEDRTFYIDPNSQTNTGGTPVPSSGTNFHTSHMPVIAAGCVGTVACESGQTVVDPATGVHLPAVCDQGNGVCRTDGEQQIPAAPSQVALDPTKRYFISILAGDAANPFVSGAGAPVQVNPACDPDTTTCATRQFNVARDCGTYSPGAAKWDPTKPDTAMCGHGIGGAPIALGQTAVTVNLEQTPLPTAKITVLVFEDDDPLNGEQDAGGGIDVLAPNEPGLGGFAITLFDQAGQLGDATGQITYDMFNMPVSNSLAGSKDPNTGLNACPISKNPDGLVGVIVTCPKYEADWSGNTTTTLSPLAGEAVIANLYPGLYEVVATPGADRIAKGEEWLQTNTLDGTKPHEAFIKPGEPAYFQEFGPAGFHVSIGFANPKIINNRKAAICAGQACNNSVTGHVTTTRLSRTPDQRLYSSGSYDANGFTQCYVSLGDPDEEDFAFTKCDANGKFAFTGLPNGNWRITVFDQWNDLLVDGLSTPVAVRNGQSLDLGDIPMSHWRTNVYTRTYFDQNGDGVSQDTEPGLPLVATNIRYRDGSIGFFNSTDLNGYAGFNEIFPFVNWLVLEADTTRYKQTGVHVVYDAGGPADGTPGGGSSAIADHLANTKEAFHLPNNLRFPGSVYCNDADCTDRSGSSPSTGRIDPPWVISEGWQGLLGQAEFIEFGKAPYAAGENGGIKGEVNYASTRPFDDPSLLLQLSWAPNVPHVTVNLYKEDTAADGTKSLSLVDTTQTSSWDDYAQGFRADGMPNMNCPGQDPTSPFFFTLQNSTNWLNPGVALPNNSQYKCYDGWAIMNQVQPAPYDGMYQFPSVTARNPTTGAPTGTNCTGCTTNPVDGTPMLPIGKYVVEVIVPPGYELVKEEDKNILIGDNMIAPVSQQFAGTGNIFIMPDQAAVNATYNPNNPLNLTTDLGSTPRHEGDTGSVESFWPCVGAKRIVPDYLSLYPGAQEVAPFAGASRNLCDRKEVTLGDQAAALAKFYIFSSTHVAAHFTGVVNDDFASEFDPFSPQYGEKFAVPNLPISIKDWAGTEISRVYSDQWGVYNGLTSSTWSPNPPNPTGYAPGMMVMCMNDPGPISDPANPGQTINDPNYNPSYSTFCYEWSFMPGQTSYLDTPVVPTAAFAEGYNPVDCAYPDTTPAIKSVTGDTSGGGAGPWVSAAGHTLTITALGDRPVPNHAYTGPQATATPFNQKTITRHYGFGATQGTGSVTIGGINAPIISWSDTQIQVAVPNLSPTQSTCTLAQRTSPASIGNSARCGQLVVTAGNGKKSIDSVTVTIAGKAPTYVNGENGSNNAIQNAIDAAAPGDLIIVGPGTYTEMLLMWKPVRLQGVGAESSIINANTHPSGKLLDPWRRKVNCLFGLALNGQPISSTNPYDPTGTYTCTALSITDNPMQVDRIPLEGILGWDTTLNGNLAELLAEPTLMGAYEGAGITVLGKGARFDCAASRALGLIAGCPWGNGSIADPNTAHEGQFPIGTQRLTNSNKDCNDFQGNFLCNPSRVDGLTITNSSQGGGGIFAHGWAHNLEISNNRVYGNTGTLTGGITVGQGEFPDPYVVGNNGDPLGYDQAPWTCMSTADQNRLPTGTQLPYCLNTGVNLHNNAVTRNASIGDELYSSTPTAAGGVTITTGSDYYHFHQNWVCGNLSTGDGGGMVHSGFSYNGDISNNWILFNQSNNPTIPTYGGGLAVLRAAPDPTLANGTECGSTNDADCPPGLAEGTGPGLVIDSNLIIGNTAESGSGGGIRLQGINGTEVTTFPTAPNNWYGVTVSNNIIADNVAGWDGGGVSMEDALKVTFINNTVIANDTTASAGVLFNTIGAQLSSSPTTPCDAATGVGCVTTSADQAAGLVTMRNSSVLTASLPVNTAGTQVLCPSGYGYGSTNAQLSDGACRAVSLPLMRNNMFWQNRAFHLEIGAFGSGPLSQQHVVTLNPVLNQGATGQCATGARYWDIGVRGDTGPTAHSSGFTLTPTNSILTSLAGGYTGSGNLGPSDPGVVRQYCNGARVPPENGGMGFNVPPGIADATSPNPVFNLTPAATVDEGNNWINMNYGPLSLSNAAFYTGPNVVLAALGDYSIQGTSPAINNASSTGAPDHDIFGTHRPQAGGFDIGAVEFVGTVSAAASVTGGPLAFGNVPTGATSTAQALTLHNAGGASLTGISVAVTAPFARPTGGAGGSCGNTLAAGGTCTINVVFAPTVAGAAAGTVTITASAAVSGSPVTLTGTGVAVPPAIASASPNPLVIHTTNLGGTTGTGTVTMTNSAAPGSQSFTITAVATSGTGFTNGPLAGPDTCTGTALAAGQSCVVSVRFTRLTGTGTRTGTLTFTDNAPGNPHTVQLQGIRP